MRIAVYLTRHTGERFCISNYLGRPELMAQRFADASYLFKLWLLNNVPVHATEVGMEDEARKVLINDFNGQEIYEDGDMETKPMEEGIYDCVIVEEDKVIEGENCELPYPKKGLSNIGFYNAGFEAAKSLYKK
jgi:hypothetical protein